MFNCLNYERRCLLPTLAKTQPWEKTGFGQAAEWKLPEND